MPRLDSRGQAQVETSEWAAEAPGPALGLRAPQPGLPALQKRCWFKDSSRKSFRKSSSLL